MHKSCGEPDPEARTEYERQGKLFPETEKRDEKEKDAGQDPPEAPLAKFCMTTGSPLFSRYTHTRTRAPVRGITPMRPAMEGNFFPIPVAMKITARLSTAFIRICIVAPRVSQHPVL